MKDFVISLIVSFVTAYFVWITQKIDQRQDKIEVDVALIKASFESKVNGRRKRFRVYD